MRIELTLIRAADIMYASKIAAIGCGGVECFAPAVASVGTFPDGALATDTAGKIDDPVELVGRIQVCRLLKPNGAATTATAGAFNVVIRAFLVFRQTIYAAGKHFKGAQLL